MRNPAFISRQIGDFQVMALSDGSMAASLTLLSGINSDDALEIQRHAGIIAPDDIDINAYLIRGQGRTILVDAGTGGGTLAASLQAAGVGAEEIDTVLLTHGHPDHIGGLLDAHGAPCFPNARLHLHPLEAEYWQDDGMLNRANERGQRNFALARRTLGAWARRLSFLDEREVVPGIRPLWLPGHTPGHCGFRIDSAPQSLLIWGILSIFRMFRPPGPPLPSLLIATPRRPERRGNRSSPGPQAKTCSSPVCILAARDLHMCYRPPAAIVSIMPRSNRKSGQ